MKMCFGLASLMHPALHPSLYPPLHPSLHPPLHFGSDVDRTPTLPLHIDRLIAVAEKIRTLSMSAVAD